MLTLCPVWAMQATASLARNKSDTRRTSAGYFLLNSSLSSCHLKCVSFRLAKSRLRRLLAGYLPAGAYARTVRKLVVAIRSLTILSSLFTHCTAKSFFRSLRGHTFSPTRKYAKSRREPFVRSSDSPNDLRRKRIGLSFSNISSAFPLGIPLVDCSVRN